MERFYGKEHLLRQIDNEILQATADDTCIEILKGSMSFDRGPWTNRRNRLKIF